MPKTDKAQPAPPPAEAFVIAPPVEPMLAKSSERVPHGADFLYEPKWDGFRAIVFRGGGHVYIQSRDLRPLDRYFPELSAVLLRELPDGCVLDGEIVIATAKGLDFDLLQQRLHPAASRVAKLAAQTPSSFVMFDALALGGKDLRALPFDARRARLEDWFARTRPARMDLSAMVPFESVSELEEIRAGAREAAIEGRSRIPTMCA